ncbi:MAG: hypothetical protein H0X29_06990 [Parachlamydiaceae bacterium]|nr:hypothetical protein [Parachlamydiaceae bacterium]
MHAVKHLKNEGVEGIKIGFQAWQESQKEVRSSPYLTWKNRIFMKLLTTSKGNLMPLLFTHGSFEDRIYRAEIGLSKMMNIS